MNTIQQIRAAATTWRASILEVGKLLAEIESNAAQDPPLSLVLSILRDEFGMPTSTARVALRWARGDFGDHAIALVSKVPHSALADMTASTIGQITADKKHRIRSAAEGRVVLRTFSQMTAKDARLNIDVKGVRPIAEAAKAYPQFRKCVAARISQDDDGRVVLASAGVDTIFMQVPEKLLRELVDLSTAGEAAGSRDS